MVGDRFGVCLHFPSSVLAFGSFLGSEKQIFQVNNISPINYELLWPINKNQVIWNGGILADLGAADYGYIYQYEQNINDWIKSGSSWGGSVYTEGNAIQIATNSINVKYDNVLIGLDPFGTLTIKNFWIGETQMGFTFFANCVLSSDDVGQVTYQKIRPNMFETT